MPEACREAAIVSAIVASLVLWATKCGRTERGSHAEPCEFFAGCDRTSRQSGLRGSGCGGVATSIKKGFEVFPQDIATTSNLDRRESASFDPFLSPAPQRRYVHGNPVRGVHQ